MNIITKKSSKSREKRGKVETRKITMISLLRERGGGEGRSIGKEKSLIGVESGASD